jgi:hypothetical protein
MIMGERLVIWSVVIAIVLLTLVLFFRGAHG